MMDSGREQGRMLSSALVRNLMLIFLMIIVEIVAIGIIDNFQREFRSGSIATIYVINYIVFGALVGFLDLRNSVANFALAAITMIVGLVIHYVDLLPYAFFYRYGYMIGGKALFLFGVFIVNAIRNLTKDNRKTDSYYTTTGTKTDAAKWNVKDFDY